MKLNFKLIVAALSLSITTQSQNQNTQTSASPSPLINKRGCGTVIPPPAWDNWFNSKVQNYKENLAAGKSQITSVTIPVVVHVIHGGQSVGTFPNLSIAQIKSQIGVMNKDFAGIGYNSYLLATTGFSAVGAANCHITFCLAQFDPNGNPMTDPGIDRINYISKGWSNPAGFTTQNSFRSFVDATVKPNTIWDPTQYFNIWITDSDINNVGILGYATFPAGSGLVGVSNVGGLSDDGIWVWSRCFGNVGTLSPPYTLGRTAVHETGHYLGLRHIGGDASNPSGDCNATDYCDDTPAQKGGANGGSNGQNFGSPAYPLHANTCSSAFGDMFMNFMDYTDDNSNYMFTPDQNIRIQTAMVNGMFRNQLNASSAALCVGLPSVDFLLDTIGCSNSNVTPLNQTAGTPAPTYSWSASPSAGVSFSPSSTNANPVVKFNTSGTYTLLMTASNSIGLNYKSLVLYIEECTGVNNASSVLNRQIAFSPNPSTGVINIKTDLPAGQNLNVSIHNSLGQLILSKHYSNAGNNAFSIDLGNCSEGVYMVSLSNEQERSVKRLIINR